MGEKSLEDLKNLNLKLSRTLKAVQERNSVLEKETTELSELNLLKEKEIRKLRRDFRKSNENDLSGRDDVFTLIGKIEDISLLREISDAAISRIIEIHALK